MMCAVRSLTIVVAWLAATLAAVVVSWLGVRTVVPEAVLAPPQIAVPAAPVTTGTPPPSPPRATTTTTAPPLTSAIRSTTTTKPVPATTTTTPSSSDVHSYTVPGGQVVLALTPTQATLVSATPASGYSVQSWEETGWLRVDFSNSAGTSTVFATWNGHPPTVQTYQT